MKSLLILGTALAALVSGPAFASADLAQKKNCLACHAADKKVIGPSYKDVAAKYAGQKDAADKLAQKIMKGGSGVWGATSLRMRRSSSSGGPRAPPGGSRAS